MHKLATILFAGGVFFTAAATSIDGAPMISAPKGPAPAPEQVIELTKTNMVFIGSEINQQSVAQAQSKFVKLVNLRGNADYPLYIVFDSPGGSVFAGNRFYESVKPYKNVHTIVLRGYSMAAMLPQMIPGKRYIIESGELLFHRMKGRPSGGTTDDISADVDYMRSLENYIVTKAVARSNMTREEYDKKVQVDWIIMAHEAVKYGFVDEVVSIKCSKELSDSKKTVLEQILPFLPPVEVVVSECPLNL
jgi:ATP-dependent protease ClpP protease subunit